MNYEELQISQLNFLRRYWDRVVAFDLETHRVNKDFLTNERILAIGLARRVNGTLGKEKG